MFYPKPKNRRRTPIHHKALIGLLLAALAMSSAEAKKLYRWVDDEGNIFYSDRVPPDESEKERAVLDDQGIQIDKVDEAKSREELIQEAERKAELERLRKEQQKLIEKQEAEDRILLRTFHTEEDIILARDNKLVAIDVAIELQRANIYRVKDRLNDMQGAAANFERQGKPIPKHLEDDIARARQQLRSYYSTMIGKEREKEVIFAQFDKDMSRFRELKNIQNPTTSDQDDKRLTSLLETVYPCGSSAQCDAVWDDAESYTRAHATTSLQVISDTIIMTGPPRKPEDISITISRIERKDDEPGYLLFMDLQCSNTPTGEDLCNSEEVAKIKRNFSQTLGAANATNY